MIINPSAGGGETKGGVSSFNGREGAVTPDTGDYSVEQVTRSAGRSMAGQTVEPVQGTTVTAGEGAEAFNDYRERTFGTDKGYELVVPQQGNVASGLRAHAEGSCTTASGDCSHAEGIGTSASGGASHAEGGAFNGANGSAATAYAAHAEGTSTEASGAYSHAEGSQTKAIGQQSHAEGAKTTASGTGAHTEGYGTTASDGCAHAEGGSYTGSEGSKATAYAAHAEGISTEASGKYSHTEGSRSKATGQASHAEGSSSTASGNSSHAEGGYTKASGDYSHAEGYSTEASGYSSHAGGCCTIAAAQYQVAIGHYNVKKSSALDAFIIGNGQSTSQRANCFRVAETGVYATGAHNSSGADYAELFEWLDGNPDHEDRCGRFVTLEGEKIRLAGPGDSFILGIVSCNPSVVGDVYDDQWQGMYLYDIFGRPLYEDVEVPDELGPDGEVLIPAHVERRQKLNPAYDHTQPYQPRSQRPEWDAVGMLGKLVMVDDGTCQVNGWCTVGDGGAATRTEVPSKYRVMARLDACHVRVLIL